MGTAISISTETLRRNSVNRRDIAILPRDPFELVAFEGPPKITDSDYQGAASMLWIDVAIIRAVTDVEATGNGFLQDGSPKILFEGHVFWRQLKEFGIDPVKIRPGNEDILYDKWTREHYVGGAGEYARLAKAIAIHEVSALKSASWGLFQIMGFNHSLCGFGNVQDYVSAMYRSERAPHGVLQFHHADHLSREGIGSVFERQGLAWFLSRIQWAGICSERLRRAVCRSFEEILRMIGNGLKRSRSVFSGWRGIAIYPSTM